MTFPVEHETLVLIVSDGIATRQSPEEIAQRIETATEMHRRQQGEHDTRSKPRQIPAGRQTEILRRAAGGYVLLTMVSGEPTYCYEDGSLITGTRHDVQRCIKNGWLRGDRDILLSGGPSQVYREAGWRVDPTAAG